MNDYSAYISLNKKLQGVMKAPNENNEVIVPI